MKHRGQIRHDPQSDGRVPYYCIPTLLGIFAGFGESLALHGGILQLRGYDPWMRAFVYTGVFCLTFAAARLLLVRLANDQHPSVRRRVTKLVDDSFIFRALLMWTCWLPYMLLTYPGILWSDTATELVMYYGWKSDPASGILTDHHPFTDTFLFGWFADFGGLWGNRAAGLFLLILLQSLLACLAMSRLASSVMKAGASIRIVRIAYAFLCLFPFVPMMFATLAKDTLFAVAFIWFLSLFVELCSSRGECCADWRFLLALAAACMLCSLTKKLGIYLAAFSLLTAVAVLGRARWRIAVGSAAACLMGIMLVIVPAVLLPALQVSKGDVTDMFVVPIQQSARLARYHAEELSDADKAVIQRTLGISAEELGERYTWYNADPAKADGIAENADATAFLAWSLRQTVKHPITAFSSWLGLEQAWFSPNTGRDANLSVSGLDGEQNIMQPIITSGNHPKEVEGLISLQLGSAGTGIVGTWYGLLAGLPAANLLLCKALWSTLLPGFLLCMAWRRGRSGNRLLHVIMIIPILLSAAVLMISPLSVSPEGTRYMFPIVVSIPYMLALPVGETMTGTKPADTLDIPAR